MSPEPEFFASITLTWVSRTLSILMPPTIPPTDRSTSRDATTLLTGGGTSSSVPVVSGSLSSTIAPLESSETEPAGPVTISDSR